LLFICHCNSGMSFKSKIYYITPQNCMYFIKENSPNLRQKRKWALWIRHLVYHETLNHTRPHPRHCLEAYCLQTILTVPRNISSNWFLKKLARMSKEQFNYCTTNSSALMWIDRYQLEANTSRYKRILCCV
jgi:hypothetical protein